MPSGGGGTINTSAGVKAGETTYINGDLLLGGSASIAISGTLEVTGSLTLDKNAAKMKLCGTGKIVVLGNLFVDNNAELSIDAGGILIVYGNLELRNNGNIQIANNGSLIVDGTVIKGDGNISPNLPIVDVIPDAICASMPENSSIQAVWSYPSCDKLSVVVSNLTSGRDYRLYDGASLLVSKKNLSNTSITLNATLSSGVHTIYLKSDVAGSCVHNIDSKVVGSPNLNYTLAGNSVCSGNPGIVTLSGSEVGVSYQLYKGAVAIGSAVAGTGSVLEIRADVLTVASTTTYSYTINASYGGCVGTIPGTAIVTVKPNPTIAWSVAPTTPTCAGMASVRYSVAVTGVPTYSVAWQDNPARAVITPSGADGSIADFSWSNYSNVFVDADKTKIDPLTIRAVATSDGCSSEVNQAITLYRQPVTGPPYHISNNVAK